MSTWKADADRFFAKVQPAADPFACLLWIGSIDKATGYGRFRLDGVVTTAHRAAYLLMVGEVPDRLQLDHRCRVRRCVSWLHLEPVSARENVLRSAAPNAVAIQTGLCSRGHDLVANAYITGQGRRDCRLCRTIRQRERTARLREAA